jgi:hypothetical protein
MAQAARGLSAATKSAAERPYYDREGIAGRISQLVAERSSPRRSAYERRVDRPAGRRAGCVRCRIAERFVRTIRTECLDRLR